MARPVAARKRWTRERIVEAFLAETERLGRVPLSSEWCTSGESHPTRDTVRRTFGSWRAALEAAGVAPHVWDQDDIIDRMLEWHETFGVPPSLRDWNPHLAELHGYDEIARYWWSMHPHWPHSSTVGHRFGSWNNAIEQAGFVPMQPGVKRSSGSGVTGKAWTREKIIQAIRDWHATYGALPTYDGWSNGPGVHRPTTHTVLRNFGSWAAACRAAGFTPRPPSKV